EWPVAREDSLRSPGVGSIKMNHLAPARRHPAAVGTERDVALTRRRFEDELTVGLAPNFYSNEPDVAPGNPAAVGTDRQKGDIVHAGEHAGRSLLAVFLDQNLPLARVGDEKRAPVAAPYRVPAVILRLENQTAERALGKDRSRGPDLA